MRSLAQRPAPTLAIDPVASAMLRAAGLLPAETDGAPRRFNIAGSSDEGTPRTTLSRDTFECDHMDLVTARHNTVSTKDSQTETDAVETRSIGITACHDERYLYQRREAVELDRIHEMVRRHPCLQVYHDYMAEKNWAESLCSVQSRVLAIAT